MTAVWKLLSWSEPNFEMSWVLKYVKLVELKAYSCAVVMPATCEPEIRPTLLYVSMPSEKLVASNALICLLLNIRMSLVPIAAICALDICAICAVDSNLMSADDRFWICVVDKLAKREAEIELISDIKYLSCWELW